MPSNYMKKLTAGLALVLSPALVQGQVSGLLENLYTKQTRAIPVSDTVSLAADVYLPIPERDIKVPVNLGQFNIDSITVFPKGQQYLVYDSVNGQPAANPRELPFLLQRTPYQRGGQAGLGALTFLGYGIAIQNNRGRFDSEGVYYPFVSNSWETEAYHPGFNHTLDGRDPADPTNSNTHADGRATVKQLVNGLKRRIDTDQDGNTNKQINLSNGSIGMIGGSAAGNTQFQAAASIPPTSPDSPGLKSLLPVVATGEYHQSTAYHNGVYRRSLVETWIQGTFLNGLQTDPADVAQDTTRTNALHTIKDYPQNTPAQAADQAVEYLTSRAFPDGKPGYYPSTPMRSDFDISRALLNEQGQPDPDGQVSRYNWLDVPTYHLTGWWDIFINGQINTWQNMAKYTDLDKNLLVIGPWTHQKIGQQDIGDVRFPDNVDQFTGSLDISSRNFNQVLDSELVPWLRSTLNRNAYKRTGEPTFVLRTTPGFKDAGGIEYKAPATDYRVPYQQMLNFLNGNGSLDNFPVAVKTPFGVDTQRFNIPATQVPGFEGLQNLSAPSESFAETPSVRVYIAGPDGSKQYGNYWLGADTFPVQQQALTQQQLYWQGGAQLGAEEPSRADSATYRHDPSEPLETIGGNNLVLRKNGELNQGPKNLKPFESSTMPAANSLQWQTKAIEDSLSILDTPKMRMHISTNYDDSTFQETLTNTHFFVRVLDVYPDGREIQVTEGAVNAHARNHAAKRADDPALDHQPPFRADTTAFRNLRVNQQYELTFNLLPIGYTFADSHRLKVVITSSNFPKYQTSPGLPLNPDSFFRWNPASGALAQHPSGYTEPKVLENTVYAGSSQQTALSLPVFGKPLQPRPRTADTTRLPSRQQPELTIYPNPVRKRLRGELESPEQHQLLLKSITGKRLRQRRVKGRFALDVSSLPPGMYVLQVQQEGSIERTRKIIKQ